jgi:hypothetical protein
MVGLNFSVNSWSTKPMIHLRSIICVDCMSYTFPRKQPLGKPYDFLVTVQVTH